ncbi:hypothetical protein VTK26DRAFT_422 [Humicola hyalothermophila]
MGISGLLPLLKSIQRPTELKKFAGETLGVDGYGWLHRGAVACAMELAQGKPTRKYVDFAMHRVRMFKYFGVTPYVVFDGDFLPSKAMTEASREKRREESKKLGLELLRAGKSSQAHAELQKAIDVTPEMARHLIEELKKADIPYLVAPYEADAQLVYLERQGLISGIVSEDSDLLVFGAKRLLTKLDQHGQCVEINRRDFCAVREISLTGWTDNEFRHMAIFSGCDYLAGVNNIGLKTAYRLIRKYKTPERIVKMLRFEGKHQVPENYLEDFKQAELTFLYQRVFCPKKQDVVLLTEPDPSVNIDEMPFIGAPVETELARSIAAGDVNPITKQRILVPSSPGKRSISQALAPASGPSRRSLGKPINEYFSGSRRIPLGEMNPNCFRIEPNRSPGNVPRPVVFPLPRPYLDTAEESTAPARSYTTRARTLRRQTEPILNLLGPNQSESSQHRRRTTGPVIEVYRDPTSSPRPPKKVRLCEEVANEAVGEERSEKSKFFPTTKEKKTVEKMQDSLMSDDSIDEVFRNLPEFGSVRSRKPVRSDEEIKIFEELSPKKPNEESLSPAESQDDAADDVVEVPASSPIQREPSGASDNPSRTPMTPLGDLLKEFSYETTRPRTKMIHGLPTPASSAPQTAGSRKAIPENSQTPLLTPLQRLGVRALQRGKPLTPQTPLSGSRSGSFGSLPINPAFVPLPKVDAKEVAALSRPVGSEDQMVPESEGENEEDEMTGKPPVACRRLDLAKFLYT